MPGAAVGCVVSHPGRRLAFADVTQRVARDRVSSAAAFLRTESGSAGVLAAAIVTALCWANLGDSYERVWRAHLSVFLADTGVVLSLRDWVNDGLMVIFFVVVGLETRREVDLGELRDRTRVLLPVAAGLGGAALSIAVFVAINWETTSRAGWGVAMSTDTALALGVLALTGKAAPDRTRIFLLTLFVVDDLAALFVITVVYSDHIRAWPLTLAVLLFVAMLAGLKAGFDVLPTYTLFGTAIWLALLGSGVDPVVTGLALGLTAAAYSPARSSLEAAFGLFRRYREQPSSLLAREAIVGVSATLSPNSRLQRMLHPWAGYVVVPLFALANAGVKLDGPSVERAVRSPFMWSIVLAYLIGKPLGVLLATLAATRTTRGIVRLTVGWASVVASGTVASTPFTVSLLIANLAFSGERLEQVRFAILLTIVGAATTTRVVFAVTDTMEPMKRARALSGDVETLVDLDTPVDPVRDHVRGPADALVTLVEYGDFECPSCGRAEAALRAGVLGNDVQLVWRHLPIPEVHPYATLAAEASEAAGAQGKFWEFHDLLLTRQAHLAVTDLMGYAEDLGLDVPRFSHDVQRRRFANRVTQDITSADASDVSGTPTFFINGRRHYGGHDAVSLTSAVRAALTQAQLRHAAHGEP